MLELPTILIAEDDDGHAFLIEDSLRQSGMNSPFIRFSDGQETLDFFEGRGLQRFERDHPYLLLLDIRMPKVDGVSVLQEIKRNPGLHKLPVIVLTTTDNPQEINRCHELGCNAYLCKPISFESFSHVIDSLGGVIRLLEIPENFHDRKQEAS